MDSDPRGQIDRVFELAREWDAEIDMHLDLADTPDGMQAEYVCRKTEEYGWGGRVAVGHATQMSLVPPARLAALAATLAEPVRPVEVVGWNGDALEAQCFAVLAARCLRGLPITYPGTTGVAAPLAGGRVANAR